MLALGAWLRMRAHVLLAPTLIACRHFVAEDAPPRHDTTDTPIVDILRDLRHTDHMSLLSAKAKLQRLCLAGRAHPTESASSENVDPRQAHSPGDSEAQCTQARTAVHHWLGGACSSHTARTSLLAQCQDDALLALQRYRAAVATMPPQTPPPLSAASPAHLSVYTPPRKHTPPTTATHHGLAPTNFTTVSKVNERSHRNPGFVQQLTRFARATLEAAKVRPRSAAPKPAGTATVEQSALGTMSTLTQLQHLTAATETAHTAAQNISAVRSRTVSASDTTSAAAVQYKGASTKCIHTEHPALCPYGDCPAAFAAATKAAVAASLTQLCEESIKETRAKRELRGARTCKETRITQAVFSETQSTV